MASNHKTGRPSNRGNSGSKKLSMPGSQPARRKRVRAISPKQLANIMDHVNDGLVVLDKDWYYVYVNQKGAEILQRQKPSDLIGKHMWTEYPEGVGHPFQMAYEKAMQEQTPVVFEAHYEPWDLWFENRIYPSPDTLTILFTEITERKRMERLLEQRQYLLQKILDTEPGTVYIYDLEERRNVYVNRHWLSEFGYTAEETQAMGEDLFTLLFHPDDLALIAKHHESWRQAEEGDIREIEYRVRTKNAEWRWVHSHEAVFTRDGAGRVKQILGISYEITPRKLAQEALRHSEQQLGQIYDTVSDIIFLLSVEPEDRYRYVSVNQAFLRTTGLKGDQVVGRYAEEIIPSASQALVFGNYKKAIQERAPVIWEEVSEYPAGTLTAIVTVNAVYNETELCTHLVGAIHDITERKQAEKALRESEEKFSKVFYASPIPLSINRLSDGRIVDINDSFLKRMGYQRDEIIGKNALELGAWVYPEERKKMLSILHEQGSLRNFEAQFRTKSGETGTALLFREIVEFAGEEYFIGTNLDITERKRAEDALAASEAELRALLAAMDDVVFVIDRDGVYRKIAPTNPKLLHKPAQELVGRSLWDVFAPDMAETFIQTVWKVIAAQETAHIEYPLGMDGKMIWFYTSISPMDADSTLWMARDITDRKQAEEEKAQLLGDLKERVKELTVLHATMELLQHDHGSTSELLQAIVDLIPLAWRYSEIASARLVFAGHASQTANFIPTPWMQSTYFSTSRDDGLIEVAYLRESPAGAEGPFLAEERRLLESLAEMLRLHFERKQAEEDLRKLNMELEQRIAARTEQLAAAMIKAQESDRLKSAFLATMSHELRTPLNSIIGFTGVILQGLAGPLNDEQTRQLHMTRDSARHLLALINDILDLSKIEAGELEILKYPFDMREAIAKAMQVVQPLLNKKKEVHVSIRIGPEVSLINQDRRRVEQVLINLINNAIKFTERGEVKIACQVRDGRLETRVGDTGIGIKPEDMHRLFKPFQQIDTGLARVHEGTGLGLSICQRLVTAMGGTIDIESQWGTGSTFIFKLPL